MANLTKKELINKFIEFLDENQCKGYKIRPNASPWEYGTFGVPTEALIRKFKKEFEVEDGLN